MNASAIVLPTLWDLGGLLSYVLDNPYLFISSSTVMTTAIVLGVMAFGMIGATARFFPGQRGWAYESTATALRWVAPKLALVLVYFGLGSMALSTEILLRFHWQIPIETEIQFRSGLGHLAIALLGIVALLPLLSGRGRREWVRANFWALGYWTLQVTLLTPPWFSFQGQAQLVMGVVKFLLAIGYAVTLYLWREERSPAA